MLGNNKMGVVLFEKGEAWRWEVLCPIWIWDAALVPLNDYLPAPFFVKKIFVGVDYFFQRRAPFQNSRKPCRRRFARILKRCAAT